MNILEKIVIENFKSFTDEEIDLSDITCFVGPNESGKTNLLDAIYHLAIDRQKLPFSSDELRLGAPGFPNGEIRIGYFVRVTPQIAKSLLDFLPGLNGSLLQLIKSGKPNLQPLWEARGSFPHASIPDVCQILEPRSFAKSFGSSGVPENIKEQSELGWFPLGNGVDLRKNPFKLLLSKKKIALLRGVQKTKFIESLLRDIVLKNLNIYFWKYENKNYLKEIVPISDFVQNPENYKSIENMFLISGWKRSEFATNLQNQTTTIYDNLLLPVIRNINSLIKNHWTTHKKLKIELKHDGADKLIVHLTEPGSSTPPEFRSDGLKWFLTFLINFRALSKTISNYILLIDEPGLHLHPRGQKDVLEELENLSANNQVVYSTHQTFLINKNSPERVRIVTRSTQRSGDLSTNPFFATKVSGVTNPKNILTDTLLREALGFKVSDISPINEENILVEGVFDREVFYLINDFFKILNLNKVSIIACGKASDINKHAALYRNNDLKVVCFYDSDVPGKAYFRDNMIVSNSNKRQIRNYLRQAQYETIEDLLPDLVFNNALKKWGIKWGNLATSASRPRMKSLETYLPPNGTDKKRLEMKHSLEDLLITEIKQHITPGDYTQLSTILTDLSTRVSK